MTRPSRPGVTFQVRPRLNSKYSIEEIMAAIARNETKLKPKPGECDGGVPQTPYEGGLLVGMADGSVKMIGPGVAPEVFWAAVTPAAGDIAPVW